MAQVILVTSGRGGAGKSTVCAYLGTALAACGKKVLLIEGSHRSLDVLLGAQDRVVFDLADALERRCELGEAMVDACGVRLLCAPPDLQPIIDGAACRELRAAGFTLEECKDFLDEPSTAVTDAMLDRQIRQLERRQVLNRMSIRFLQRTREYYHTLEQDAGRVWVQNFPEMWRLVLSQEEEARNDPALQAEKAEWLECMPAVHWVSRLPSRVMEQFRVGRNEYDYGLLVEADAARQLGLRRTDHVELVCGGDYLTTVWKKDYRGSFGWDSLEVLHAEILRRGFRAVGDTFSSILASREQPDGSIINYHLTRTKVYT